MAYLFQIYYKCLRRRKNTAVNDEIDLTSLLSVLLENFNLLISIFLATIPVLGIYYLTSTEVFKPKHS